MTSEIPNCKKASTVNQVTAKD